MRRSSREQTIRQVGKVSKSRNRVVQHSNNDGYCIVVLHAAIRLRELFGVRLTPISRLRSVEL